MGLKWKKEEVYDKKLGRFVPKERQKKELTREEQFEKRKHIWQLNPRREAEKKMYREAYEKARIKGKLERARKEGYTAGRTSTLDRLNKMLGPPPSKRRTVSIGTTSRKHRSSKKKHKRSTKRRPPRTNAWGDFDIV